MAAPNTFVLPTSRKINDLPFVPCYQLRYIRPLMPPFEQPMTFNKVIPPDSTTLLNKEKNLFSRLHIRGDLQWYDFVKWEKKINHFPYHVSKQWYLPGETVDMDQIQWEKVNQASTLIDNGSLFYDLQGNKVDLETCQGCGVTEYNHVCDTACTFMKRNGKPCGTRDELRRCQVCQISLMCRQHQEGINGASVCDSCVKSHLKCPACQGYMSTSEIRQGITRHKVCPVIQTSCAVKAENKIDCLVKRHSSVKFVFRTPPFSNFFKEAGVKMDSHTFGSVFTTLCLCNKDGYFYVDEHSHSFQYNAIIEMLISWRTALLAVHRQQVPELQSKTPKNIYSVFRNKFGEQDRLKDLELFLGDASRLYACGSVDYDLLFQCGVARDMLNNFLHTLVDMISYVSDHQVSQVESRSSYDSKASRPELSSFTDGKRIRAFFNYLQKLANDNKEPANLKHVKMVTMDRSRKLSKIEQLELVLKKPITPIPDDLPVIVSRTKKGLVLRSGTSQQNFTVDSLLHSYNTIIKHLRDVQHRKEANAVLNGKKKSTIEPSLHPLGGFMYLKKHTTAREGVKHIQQFFRLNPMVKEYDIQMCTITYDDDTTIQARDLVTTELPKTTIINYTLEKCSLSKDKIWSREFMKCMKKIVDDSNQNWAGYREWTILAAELTTILAIAETDNEKFEKHVKIIKRCIIDINETKR